MTTFVLVDILNNLISQQNNLAAAIKDETHSIWMPGIADEDDKYGEFYCARKHHLFVDQAIQSINSIEFMDGQEGRSTQKSKGILLVGPSSLELAQHVNQLKQEAGGQIAAIRSVLPKKTSVADYLSTREEIQVALNRAGIARLCVNQLKRSIPVVVKAPYRIALLERRTKSIRRVSVEQASNMLNRLTSQQSDIDLEALGQLSASTPLAIIQQPQTPTFKANIFYRDVVEGEVQTVNQQIHAPVPILCATGHEMPRIHKGGSRAKAERSDIRLESSPYLKSIRAHLYLPTHA